jgi:glycerol-3-phosphate dehydrogenase
VQTPADATDREVDLLIVGGGINGVGIARDAAGRGLSVLLVEQSDLASATSSASTKLIHGGLRYLEYYEFRLVREALREREVLLAMAPHIIWPLRFVLPHERHLRPAWLIRLGLFLYDHLGGCRKLQGSRAIDLCRPPVAGQLRPEFTRGFVYSDCCVQDSRLVVLNALDARERGATVLTRSRCSAAARAGGRWRARIDSPGGSFEVAARALVNAAGAWAGAFLASGLGRSEPARLRLIKGSHIVVPRLYEGEHAFILQNADRRIVFAIPFEGRFTLIGTTDVPYEDDPANVAISGEEVAYLCQAINGHFVRQIAPSDVVWSYAGVRPLYNDAAESAAAVTRDYVLELEPGEGAPLLCVFGGKITTYRRLAEQAMEKLAPFFPTARPAWTGGAPLPGGDMADADFDRFLASLRRARPWLPDRLALRYARAYGTRTLRLLGSAGSLAELGRHYGDQVYEAEIAYLADQEWAGSAADMLWRRSKLGLHVSAATRAALEERFAGRRAQAGGR